MRRIILLLTLVLVTSSTIFAQTSTQIDFDRLKKQVEKSNSNIEHHRRGERFRTWLKRGDLMHEVYNSMLLEATTGLHINEFELIIGKPNAKSEEEVDGEKVVKYEMDRVNFYFKNDLLESWEFTDEIVEEPLQKAYDSYMKARELDTKGRAEDRIKEGLTNLKYSIIGKASNCYAMEDFDCSFKNFAKAVEIGEDPLVNQVDTVVLFYAGLSAQLNDKLEEAIKFYEKSLEYDFTSKGNVYYNIYEAYVNLEKDDKAVEYLEEGFLEHPKNQNILYGLINHYLTRGEDPDIVLEYIKKAQDTDPDDQTLYFAEGTLHDKLENPEKAEEAYKKAIDLDPEFFDALFNLGALYFNNGVSLIEEANKVPAKETEKYDELVEKSAEEFKASIPYMEKAYEVNPEHKGTIETLRNLYFRFRNQSDEIQEKLDEINEVWSNME
ncbi:MAG: tetratricopeptide repeat protein [Bacteroidales bacterium]